MPRLSSTVLALALAAPAGLAAQTGPAAEIIALNRSLLEQMIVERDATLFTDVALDGFVVVAPGGVVENRAQSAAGVRSFDASAITLSDERVAVSDDTAVLVGKLVIDGVMQPVGALPPLKFMAVFVSREGRWRLLARSLTPCLPIAIERGVC